MTKTYFPFDAGTGSAITESQWRKMAEFFISTGVLDTQLNELEVFADASGMNVKVKSGKAWVKGHYFESTAQETLTITAADGSNPRIDRVVVKADFTANTIDLVVLAGTPAGSPVAPSLTQSATVWEISLAQVLVGTAVANIAADKVTDERTIVQTGDVVAARVARVYRNAALNITTTPTAIAWDAEVLDTHAHHDNATNNSRLIAKVAGKYRIAANVLLSIPGVSAVRATIAIRKNGVATDLAVALFENPDTGVSANDMTLIIDDVLDLALNDYVEVFISIFSGTQALNVGAASDTRASFIYLGT